MTFKSTLDNRARSITIAVAALFIITILLLWKYIDHSSYVSPVVSIFLVIIYLIGFAHRPESYFVNEDEIVIRRPFTNVRINKAAIKHIERLDKLTLAKTSKHFGVDGLFGYFGNYTNPALGNMRWFGTRKDKAVLIVSNNDSKIVVTPDDPEHFILAING